MKHFLIICLLGGCFITTGLPQSIDINDFRADYLAGLVKEGVDRLREKKHLDPLIQDSILTLAAQDHADYLTKNKTLSHFQKKHPRKKTPFDRINYYGGDHFKQVGENIVMSYVMVPIKIRGKIQTYEEYQETAEGLVKDWKKSRVHYNNIITRAYNQTGLAISFDQKSMQIYGVQVFGQSDKPASGSFKQAEPASKSSSKNHKTPAYPDQPNRDIRQKQEGHAQKSYTLFKGFNLRSYLIE